VSGSTTGQRAGGQRWQRLFSTYQVADLLGATPGTVMQWMQKGWLPYQRMPDGPVRISEGDLVTFLRGRGINMEELLERTLRHEGETRARPNGNTAGPAALTFEPPPPRAAAAAEDQSATSREPEGGASDADGVGEDERAALIGALGAPSAEPASREAGVPTPEPHAGPTPEEIEELAARYVSEPLTDVPDLSDAEESSEAPADETHTAATEEVEAQAVEAEAAAGPTGGAAVPEEPAEQRTREAGPVGAEMLGAAPARPGDAAEQVLHAVLEAARAARASHVHWVPHRDGLSLHLRIDGVLCEKPSFRRRFRAHLAPRLLLHLKLRAGLNPAETQRPQQGTFELAGEAGPPIRVRTFPTQLGERVVWELPAAEPALRLDDLLLPDDQRDALRRLLARPAGLVLVAAPPRHGGAETLQALLAEADTAARSVLAVARRVQPADAPAGAASWARVAPRAGFGISDALLAAAQHDADVILATDLPDPTAAQVAVDAALDGALVLAGVAAADAVAALERLLTMGLEPWPLSDALSAGLAVRTVRRLCEACRRRAEDDGFESVGCEQCSRTGYRGVLRVGSLLLPDAGVRTALRAADGDALRTVADLAQPQSIRQALARAVQAGHTSGAEADRALGRA